MREVGQTGYLEMYGQAEHLMMHDSITGAILAYDPFRGCGVKRVVSTIFFFPSLVITYTVTV